MYYLYRLSYVTEAKIQSLLPIPPAGVLLLLIVKLGQPKCDSSILLPWLFLSTSERRLLIKCRHFIVLHRSPCVPSLDHALPPAVSSYARCFSLHAYTIIYLYTYTYQSYSVPSCQSNQAHPHKPPLQSPILPAIEHRDWPRRCERHLNDLKFETLEIGGNRITTRIALTSWVIYFCKLLNDPEHIIYNSWSLKWIMSWYIVLGSGCVAKLIKMDQWWSMEVCFTRSFLFSIQAQGSIDFHAIVHAAAVAGSFQSNLLGEPFNNGQVSYCTIAQQEVGQLHIHLVLSIKQSEKMPSFDGSKCLYDIAI